MSKNRNNSFCRFIVSRSEEPSEHDTINRHKKTRRNFVIRYSSFGRHWSFIIRHYSPMVYYDHAMLGATLAVAVGAQRRQGWPIVILAALAGMFPDWDALSSNISPQTYRIGHRVWGHNLFAVTLAGIVLGLLGYWISQSCTKSTDLDSTNGERQAGEAGFWIVLCVLIMWSHPLLDFL